MRVIRKQCEHGERPDKEEAVSSGSWKEHSEVHDYCNIQEEKLDEANDTHWEIYDSAVDESTSTDDDDCHDHRNEVHEVEVGELQIVKEQIVKEQIVTTALINLSPAITLLNS